MDPSSSSSSSNCENIGEVSRDGWAEGELLGMDKELLEKDFSSSAATAALDCEDSRDGGDAQESLLNNEDFNIYELLYNASSDSKISELLLDTSSYCEEYRNGYAEEEEEELGINLIKAAMKGNEQIFDEPNLSLEHFSRKGVEKNNILHIALRCNQIEFVKALLLTKKYMAINMKLLSERNSQGNTPFHVAAQVCSDYIVRWMYGLYKYMSVEGGHDDDEKPWRAQNPEGNTALHVALLSGNFFVAEYLVKKDGGLAGMVNNSQEAPLHLAITHLDDLDNRMLMTDVLLKTARCVATWRDAKGLTPLLRAASLSHPCVTFEVTKQIIDVCPESTLMCDPFGKSFLHLFIHNNKIFRRLHQNNLDEQFYFDDEDIENIEDLICLNGVRYIEDLICLNEVSILKDHQDQDGNTPLHIALICGNIHMARSLVSKCSADPDITNKDGISARFMIDQLHLRHQIFEPRAMTKEESSSASKGDINFLLDESKHLFVGFNFYGSQDSKGNNFLHLLMNTTTEHYAPSHHYSYCHNFLQFITKTLYRFPKLVCQTDRTKNTPIHILAQNKDICNIMHADHITTSSESRGPLSRLLSICDDAITKSKSRRTIINESDNHDIPWVMQNADGNTPLHEAIIANNKVLVLELLSYSEESANIFNKHKETPLHLLAATSTNNGMEEFTVEEIVEMVKANSKALGLQDKNGHIPMSRAIEVKNLNVVVTLLCNFQDFSNTNDKTLWQNFCVMTDQLNSFLKELFQNEAFRRMMLGQKNKDGNTLLHIAIQEKCFGFVRELLETQGSKRESSEDNPWLMDLLKISNNVGVTSEDLLADLPTIPKKLEEKLLTDRRMRGIRSSWRIPRTQLQNYMNSMNVIAALQTTITFTAAFTVPGGLFQDTGAPMLIRSIAFQVFMISDVIAMCLSMMVLICLLWMVATNKRKSVMIQDFTITLLLASFFATLLTFMTGVYATVSHVKPWIAIVTLVLCSLLMLLIHRFMVTELLLPFKNAISNFVHMLLDPAAKAIKKLKSDESEHTRLGNSDTSPYERDIVITE